MSIWINLNIHIRKASGRRSLAFLLFLELGNKLIRNVRLDYSCCRVCRKKIGICTSLKHVCRKDGSRIKSCIVAVPWICMSLSVELKYFLNFICRVAVEEHLIHHIKFLHHPMVTMASIQTKNTEIAFIIFKLCLRTTKVHKFIIVHKRPFSPIP